MFQGQSALEGRCEIPVGRPGSASGYRILDQRLLARLLSQGPILIDKEEDVPRLIVLSVQIC